MYTAGVHGGTFIQSLALEPRVSGSIYAYSAELVSKALFAPAFAQYGRGNHVDAAPCLAGIRREPSAAAVNPAGTLLRGRV